MSQSFWRRASRQEVQIDEGVRHSREGGDPDGPSNCPSPTEATSHESSPSTVCRSESKTEPLNVPSHEKHALIIGLLAELTRLGE